MFFTVTELEKRKIEFDVTYPPGEIAISPELRQEGDLRAVGSAELLPNTLGEIRVRGQLTTSVVGSCDRCLEDAKVVIDQPFDLFYRPIPKDSGHHEHRLAEGEVDLSFYKGETLELEEVLREFVLLCLPMRLFCREDCKGICTVCGENRNMVDCGCAVRPADPRWDELKKFVSSEADRDKSAAR